MSKRLFYIIFYLLSPLNFYLAISLVQSIEEPDPLIDCVPLLYTNICVSQTVLIIFIALIALIGMLLFYNRHKIIKEDL